MTNTVQTTIQSRWKSPVLWAGIASVIYLVAKNWFGFEIPAWADISSEIIAILTLIVGVTNNPTDKKHI
jgi:uncharacterized membrane protein